MAITPDEKCDEMAKAEAERIMAKVAAGYKAAPAPAAEAPEAEAPAKGKASKKG